MTVSSELDASLLFSVMEQTFARQNRSYPYPYELIERIVKKTSCCDHGRMFVARDEASRVHACSFLVYDDKSSYALLGGADPKYRNSGAKSLVWYNEILFAASNSAYFDFEGSNIESIENFVRQFGGERVVNYQVSKGSVLKEFAEVLKPRVKKLIGYKI